MSSWQGGTGRPSTATPGRLGAKTRIYAAPPATGSSTASSCRPVLSWSACSVVARTRTRYPLWMSPGSQPRPCWTQLQFPPPFPPCCVCVGVPKHLGANCNALTAVLLTDLCILHVALETQKGTFKAGSSPVSGILAGTGTFHSLSPASWYQSSSSLVPTTGRATIRAFLSIHPQNSSSKSHIPTLPSLHFPPYLPLSHQHSS